MGANPKTEHIPPLLFNLDIDPSEENDIAALHPEVIAEIRKIWKRTKKYWFLLKTRWKRNDATENYFFECRQL